MAKVTVVLSVATRSFPAGTQAGPMRVTLTNSAGESVFLEGDESSFVFDNVAPGDYLVGAGRLDAAGQPLGDAITQAVTVAPSAVDITVPVSMVVQTTP